MTSIPARHAAALRQRGFTITELLLGIAVIGIMAAFAVPSVNNMMVGQRIKSASFDVVAALTLARSEAIKQNGAVTIAPVSGTTSWASGWTTTGPDAAVITSQGAYPSTIVITGPTSIVYNRSGRSASSTTQTLQIGPATGTAVTPRCVSVSLTGQPKSTVGACS